MNEWIAPKPTEYAGVRFRSRLEAWWASTLDHYGIRWDYEPKNEDGSFLTIPLPSGARYRPDFWLDDLDTILEVKGAHMLGAEKTRELASVAREMTEDGERDWIVIFGWSPQLCREPGEPAAFMRWQDAAGYNALFGKCQCGAWQWCRPRNSLNCRKCGERLGPSTHLEGPHGTVPFVGGADLEFSLSSLFGNPAALCRGSGSRTASIPTRRSSRRGMKRSACTSAAVRTPPSI